MALSLANLLIEYKLAIRDSNAEDSDCYAALNSVKDEFQNEIIPYLGGNALNATPSSLSIALSSGTYSYATSSASPAIGCIIQVKANLGGTYYKVCRRTSGEYYDGMYYDPNNLEYRISGTLFEPKFYPTGTAIIYYAPQITTVSASYTGTSTTQSYQIDEVDRAWAWYAGARHFESIWNIENAALCRKVAMDKIYKLPKGSVV